MIDEKLQEQLLKVFEERFQNYNTKVLEELGKVIKQFQDLTPSQAYQLSQQLKYNTTVNDLLNELSKISGMSVEDLKKVLENVAKENLGFADVYYKAQGLETPLYSENKALQRLVNSVYKASGAEFKNISKTTGFRLLDNDGNPLLLDIDQTYKEVIDRSVLAISQGKETYQQSMRSTLKQLSKSGCRKLEYESGYSRRLDTSVRMNVLDSIRQVSNESQKLFGEEFGADMIEISTHEHPASDHLMQGRQFLMEEYNKLQNGENAKDLQGKIWNLDHNEDGKFRPISTMSCYHYVFSGIAGISEPQYSNEQLQKIIDDNNKGAELDGKHYTIYELSQILRRLETSIREQKDLQILAKASNDKDLILQAQTKITQLTNKYKEVVKISGLPNQLSRRAVVSNYHRISVKKLK